MRKVAAIENGEEKCSRQSAAKAKRKARRHHRK
jgi:hypothetical protein